MSLDLRKHLHWLQAVMYDRWDRHVSVGDLLMDRWETAQRYGWGEGASCYDNVLILGDVKVGKQTWVGPNTVLDGSGGLEIGDFCSISAGAQIYSHNSVRWAVSMGAAEIERRPTRIGSGVYIGPNAVISMGVTIGDRAIIGAMTFVAHDVLSDSVFSGRTPMMMQPDTISDGVGRW